ISGHWGAGVLIENDHGNTVAGNYLGTDKSGTAALGNQFGVEVSAGATDSTVGGTAAGAGNVVAFNLQGGIRVDGNGNPTITHGISILGNSIFENADAGIELVNGGNDDQAAPTITSVVTAGGSTMIQGTLSSTPSTQFRVELFSSPSCDPSGAGEGETFLGSADATTNGSGVGTFSKSVSALPPGRAVTGTATSPGGDTSEFSGCFTSP